MKTEVIPFKAFVRGEWKQPSKLEIIVKHIDRHKVVYQVAGMTFIVLLAGASTTFASSSAIDIKAGNIYHKLVGIGKWVIIFKGGFDTIKGIADGDHTGARKSFFSYLIVYLLLLALPWAMNQIDETFAGM